MQCLNCGFENMPGQRRCGRCESSLTIEDISVEPHRASSLRLSTRWAQLQNSLVSGMTRALHFKLPSIIPRIRTPNLWPALARTVIPGLGHLHLRHRVAGWVFLSLWLSLLIFSIITLPSDLSVWLLAGAITVHAAAVASVFSAELSFERIAVRAAFGILLFIALRQFVYSPIGSVAGSFWQPLLVPDNFTTGPVLNPGDGVLYEGAWLRPDQFDRGDIVYYRIPNDAGAGYRLLEGGGIDRVVGVPGDEVSIDGGRLTVNGVEPDSAHSPLGKPVFMPNAQISLREGEYAVIPTRIQFGAASPAILKEVLPRLMIVPESSVYGRIRFRLQPWSRFGWIH